MPLLWEQPKTEQYTLIHEVVVSFVAKLEVVVDNVKHDSRNHADAYLSGSLWTETRTKQVIFVLDVPKLLRAGA